MKRIALLFFSMLVMNLCFAGQAVNEGKESPVKHLTKVEFMNKVYNYEKNPDKWVYEGNKPAIVDFYATWCGPCKAIAPVLEELAKEYEGKIVIYKLLQFLPDNLPLEFCSSDIRSLCRLNSRQTSYFLLVLRKLGLIEQVGIRNRFYLYRVKKQILP